MALDLRLGHECGNRSHRRSGCDSGLGDESRKAIGFVVRKIGENGSVLGRHRVGVKVRDDGGQTMHALGGEVAVDPRFAHDRI